MTGESKFKKHYEDITTDSGIFDIPAISIAKDWGTNDPGLTSSCSYLTADGKDDNYYRFNIIAPEIFMLNAMASFGGHSSTWLDVLSVLWNGNSGLLVNWDGVKDHKNSLFDTFVALGKNGGSYDYQKTSGHDSLLAKATKDAVKQLGLYPAGARRKTAVLNSSISEKKGCTGTAESALDMNLRGTVEYVWQRSPMAINQPCHQPWVEYTGLDYLLPYWMVRYSGYFRKPTVSIASASALENGKSKTDLSFKVTLSDWIPDTHWELSQLSNVALYKGTTLVHQGPISLSKALTWADAEATLTLALSSKLSAGTYKVRVTHTINNLPASSYPGTTSVPIDVWSPEFTVK